MEPWETGGKKNMITNPAGARTRGQTHCALLQDNCFASLKGAKEERSPVSGGMAPRLEAGEQLAGSAGRTGGERAGSWEFSFREQ